MIEITRHGVEQGWLVQTPNQESNGIRRLLIPEPCSSVIRDFATFAGARLAVKVERNISSGQDIAVNRVGTSV